MQKSVESRDGNRKHIEAISSKSRERMMWTQISQE